MDNSSNENVINLEQPSDMLTDLIRNHARQLIKEALELEVAEVLQEFKERRLADGRQAVCRSGYQPEREIQTGIGPVPVKVPKIRSRDGQPESFNSALVPPFIKRTRSLEAAIPWLYLQGISSGNMCTALEALVGPEAKGLSANTVSRLKQQWSDEYNVWRQSDLSKDEWVYIWADGIYSGLRAEDEKLCVLVVMGVNQRGEKHFLAIEDGVRESTQSWQEVLLKLKNRGLKKAPKLAIGDGAMGFWAALDKIYPSTKQQRCWVHKTRNVLNYLPKKSQSKAKEMLHDIWNADTKKDAEKAFDLWIKVYQDKQLKAAQCLEKDREELLAFYDFPAVHWQSIRTTNPIESAFSTIRHRTKRAKGCLSRVTMLSMIFKVGMCAESQWRKLRGFESLAQVIRGIQFKDGVELNKKEQKAA